MGTLFPCKILYILFCLYGFISFPYSNTNSLGCCVNILSYLLWLMRCNSDIQLRSCSLTLPLCHSVSAMSKRRMAPNRSPELDEQRSLPPEKLLSPPDVSTRTRSTGTSDWKKALGVAVILAAISAVYTVYRRSAPFATALVKLPESYALCTPEGGKVYTVDESQLNVDCLLVSRDRILSAGTIGTCYIVPVLTSARSQRILVSQMRYA